MTPHQIFVVEDEAIVAMDITRRLERLGYQVVGTASSGEDALKQIGAQPPELVLMDIRLAGRMDGIETALLVKRLHDIPVIFLTAHTDTGTLGRAKVAEPYGYIVKPIETTQLSTTILMALHKYQMEMRLKASEAKFRQLAEVNPAIIVVFQPTECPGEYHIPYVNPAFHTTTGVDEVPTSLRKRVSPSTSRRINSKALMLNWKLFFAGQAIRKSLISGS